MKTALREIAQIHTGDFRLTPSQNLSIAGVTAAQKPLIDAILAKHGLTERKQALGMRLNALSCVALPTCGLALAESERSCPDILEKFETVLDEAGLKDDAISLRVTGCPNGCARPYLAEIGLVGKAPNKYALYLGASYNGTRLNRLVSPSVTIDDAVTSSRRSSNATPSNATTAKASATFATASSSRRTPTFHSVGTPGPTSLHDGRIG
jgi:sulfite reductase (NADPH) hemoprotein beta-component